MLVYCLDPLRDPPVLLVCMQHYSKVKDCLGIGNKGNVNVSLIHNLVYCQRGSLLLRINVPSSYMANRRVSANHSLRGNPCHEVLVCAILGLYEVHV